MIGMRLIMKKNCILIALALPVACAFARTQEIALWRGETQTFRLQDFAHVSGEPPQGVVMRLGVLRDVDYRESPEAVRWQKASQEISPIEGLKVDETLKPLHRYTVADRVDFSVAAAKCCPRIVEFAAAREAKPGTYALGDVVLRIVDRELPPSKEWKSILDLWQHPWAVARIAGVEPFSPEHYAKMRPLWKMLAEAGGRALTVTLVDQPWNHQCYDAYESMVGKVRHADGRWTYDFTRFDEYVAFGRECGLGPMITCYTMCPWGYLVDWRDEAGAVHKAQSKPGTPFFEEYWGAFLPVFAAHLREKGWLGDTYIAMDERSREDMMNVGALIRRCSPELKVSTAGDKRPSEMEGIDIAHYCQSLTHVTPEFLAEAAQRRAEGKLTTYYVCCWPPRPNTFMSSGAGEAYWCGFYPAAAGLDGVLRWAYNSWGEDPMNDMSYGDWLAGDTALVYPDGSPSWRFVELRRGLVAGEKFRILCAAGALDAAEVSSIRSRFDVQKAMTGGTIFHQVEEWTEAALNKDVKDVLPVPKKWVE